MDKRRGRVKWGINGTRSVTSDAYWRQPIRWNKQAESEGVRRRVFCASLADVFEDREELWLWRANLFDLIDETPNLDWLLLTKRPENILKMWPTNSLERAAELWGKPGGRNAGMFRSNIWLGTSISDQATADKAIFELLKCRDLAPVLFLSAEPLLGPIKFRYGQLVCRDCDTGTYDRLPDPCPGKPCGIDWVIVGGESGHNARPCDLQWIRSIRDECQAVDVPCFVKQIGAITVDSAFSEPDGTPGVLLGIKDKKGGDPAEWPKYLRAREFPRVTVNR